MLELYLILFSLCRGAADEVGMLLLCDQGQMRSYITHAISAFGDLSTWDTSTLTTVGTMIGT